MECVNHPGTLTDRTCYECGLPFCLGCFSKVDHRFCRKCYAKLYGPKYCEAANEALTMAIIGVFCLGIVFEPLALIEALEARRQLREHPELSGWGKATAALWMASILIVVNLIFIGMLILDQ